MHEPILLSCGHWKSYVRPIPAIGAGLYCSLHGPVYRVDSINYKIHCEDCSYRRYVGNSPITAQTRGTKHSITKHHHVRILKYENAKYVSETEVGKRSNLTLDEILEN